MRKATKTVATWFGIAAGLAGMEHGYFEILQGNTRPAGVVIASIGPPCVAEEIWNACEPALTILPNFLITGILAVIIGLVITLWSGKFLEQKKGGAILILLSILLLLFGGGFFPPIIGLVGGIAGLQVNQPISQKSPKRITKFAARLWPWPLGVFIVWVFGQWLVGYFFNDWLQRNMVYGVVLILAMMPLSVYAAYAYDAFVTR